MHPPSGCGLSLLALVASADLRGAYSFVAPSLVATKHPSSPKSRLNYKSPASPPPITLPKALRPTTETVPKIIQGGMGVRISSWNLAREVSRRGELGVVSGTAMVSYSPFHGAAVFCRCIYFYYNIFCSAFSSKGYHLRPHSAGW